MKVMKCCHPQTKRLSLRVQNKTTESGPSEEPPLEFPLYFSGVVILSACSGVGVCLLFSICTKFLITNIVCVKTNTVFCHV